MSRWIVAGALLSGVALLPGQAHAQQAEPTPVTGTAKGIVGGGLLGAEIVMMPMGIAGLKPWWPYVVFGAVGAAGGAVGGWAIEQAAPPAEAPLYMLAGGLALVIPTLVLTLNATTHEDAPPEEEGDKGADQQAIPGESQPGAPGGPVPGEAVPPGEGTTIKVEGATKGTWAGVRRHPRRSHPMIPVSLFDLQGEEVRMGVPAVEVRPVYSQEELAKFGLDQETEVRVPVFRAAF